MWKCLVDSEELIAYEKVKSNLMVRIEARLSEKMWEIYKTYHSMTGKLNFTEEYEANDRKNAVQIITKIKKEILDEDKIKKIQALKKNLSIKIKRLYKEQNVEKWSFSINDEDYSNFIIVRYSTDIEMDILSDERYKYVETEILDEINKVLGINEFETDIVQNIFFFSKKSAFYTCDDNNDSLGKVELGLEFSKEE
ncbi:MAG: hypothetical protein ACLFPQ_04490 [Candidatus Woesearchaeota archaeon]